MSEEVSGLGGAAAPETDILLWFKLSSLRAYRRMGPGKPTRAPPPRPELVARSHRKRRDAEPSKVVIGQVCASHTGAGERCVGGEKVSRNESV